VRRVTLVRHAQAAAAAAGGRDLDRPLNDAGIAEARAAAVALAAALPVPDLLLASSAFRTLATAQLLHDQVYRSVPLRAEPQLYLATPAVLQGVLRGLDDACTHVIIVGHNPGISQWCTHLAGDGREVTLGTAAWRSFPCPAGRWVDLG
jgi:phosphohistidine phosphatase